MYLQNTKITNEGYSDIVIVDQCSIFINTTADANTLINSSKSWRFRLNLTGLSLHENRVSYTLKQMMAVI